MAAFHSQAPTPLHLATIEQLTAALDAGTLTSERLVEISLARVAAYDTNGPKLKALLAINPHALATARSLDTERKSAGRRSPLHGIPVIVKDNFDTHDMPTTAGSVFLEGCTPKQDALVVERLRLSGAIILAKANMSEFAVGDHSSIGGRARNPHALDRTASSSSSGTGVAIAAAYAPLGFGTDTGGSIRGPASVNGVAGLKPTHGLVSCRGVVPLARTFDTAGPMARSVADLAIGLDAVSGVDIKRTGGQAREERFGSTYTKHLRKDALTGARIGVARDFMGQDSEVAWVVEASISRMKAAGATFVDVRFPKWLLDSKAEFYYAIRNREFAAQIADYLACTGPAYPKTIADLIARAEQFNASRLDGAAPNPARWAMFRTESSSGSIDDADYVAIRDFGLPLVQATIAGVFSAHGLEAIVYPPMPRRPALTDAAGGHSHGPGLPTNLANLSGFPDLVVPAGCTADGLPVAVSFFGLARSEPRLLALGYAFEQIAQAYRLPIHTPPLDGELL